MSETVQEPIVEQTPDSQELEVCSICLGELHVSDKPVHTLECYFNLGNSSWSIRYSN